MNFDLSQTCSVRPLVKTGALFSVENVTHMNKSSKFLYTEIFKYYNLNQNNRPYLNNVFREP